MSHQSLEKRNKIHEALINRGFTGDINLIYTHEGWLCNCDQMTDQLLGMNIGKVLIGIKTGDFDYLLGNG